MNTLIRPKIYRLIKLFTFGSLFYFSSCNTNHGFLSQDVLLSFVVDSFKTYDLDNKIVNDHFIFSPLSKVDKIWATNKSDPHELDLLTGKWTSLQDIYGMEFRKVIRPESIWKDNFTNDVYFSYFQDKLIRYNSERDTFESINLKTVTALLPLKDLIVIGTADGLYFLNRSTNTFQVARNLPLDLWVNSIEELKTGTLVINNRNTYDIHLEKFSSNFLDESNEYMPKLNDRISVQLGTSTINFKVIKGKHQTWYYNEYELHYTTDNKNFFTFNKTGFGEFKYVTEDDQHLYIIVSDKLVVFKKEYIFKNSGKYKNSNFYELSTDLIQTENLLNENPFPLSQYIKKIIEIQEDGKYNKFSDLKTRVSLLPSGIANFNFDNTTLFQAIDVINDNDIPVDFRYYTLAALCKKYTTEGNLVQALKYFDRIKLLTPYEKDRCIESSFLCVKKSIRALDSLKSIILSKDELLFKEAIVLSHLIQCSCWFGESYYHYDLVENKYNRLLSTFPNSEFADDAAYWLLDNRYFFAEDGGYDTDSIPEIRKFIKRYPNSNNIIDLLLNISSSYAEKYSDNIDELIRNIDLGIAELENLKKKYPLDSRQSANVNDMLGRFLYDKYNHIFDLSIVPNKTNYYFGEDIIIDVTLKNKSSQPRLISLYANHSFFKFDVDPNVHSTFEPFANVDTIKREYLLAYGQPIKQTIVLNKKARSLEDGGKLGRYVINTTGVHYINAFAANNYVSSSARPAKIYLESRKK